GVARCVGRARGTRRDICGRPARKGRNGDELRHSPGRWQRKVRCREGKRSWNRGTAADAEGKYRVHPPRGYGEESGLTTCEYAALQAGRTRLDEPETRWDVQRNPRPVRLDLCCAVKNAHRAVFVERLLCRGWRCGHQEQEQAT